MGYAEKFRRYLVEDGKSPSTITSYVGDVEGFLCYLEYKGGQFDGQLRRFYVTSYKQHLEDQGYKVNTINKKMNSLVCFNQFLVDQGVMESMVVNLKKDKIRIAYGSEQEVEVYTDGEVERLLFYIQDRSKVSVRDKLVILLLLYTGIRVGELVSIKLQDIDFLTMQLHILGKGGKIREVPLRAEVVEVAKEYLTTERKVHKYADSEYLLLTERSSKRRIDRLMDSRETKRTVPVPSVGADGEQPISQTPTASITEETTENNPPEKNYAELLRKMQRMNDPAYLPTISMNELYENVYQSRPPVIDGLLYPGTYLFAGAPKVGKSFLMAQLAYHVSMGLPLWDYPVHKGTVLYLALEDDHRRLQERLYRMFGMDGTNDLLFSICAKQVGNGLEEQLKRFVQEHPDTKLIIIDTLQKIREAGGDKYSYANDYEVVGKLKRLADACGVCLLLVHHTRKQQADDKFDMISGTNGLSGAADGAFLLQKEKRTDGTATLDVVGRDQQDQRLYLIKDKEHLTWTLERMETELWVEPPDPVLEAVAAFITAERPSWGGTATELAAALQVDMKPNALAMRLNVRAGKLATDYHIRYENTRTHAGRSISLTLDPPQA